MVRADLRREFDVLERREIGDQIVELENEADVVAAVGDQVVVVEVGDVTAAHHHGAARRGVHAAQNVERGRLARARLAQDHAQLAFVSGEARAVERADRRIPSRIFLDDAIELDVCHRALLSHSSHTPSIVEFWRRNAVPAWQNGVSPRAKMMLPWSHLNAPINREDGETWHTSDISARQ